MAKPIRKSPSLHGEQAKKFVDMMISTEKRRTNRYEKEFIRLISK